MRVDVTAVIGGLSDLADDRAGIVLAAGQQKDGDRHRNTEREYQSCRTGHGARLRFRRRNRSARRGRRAAYTK
jgi:hypothetical protein